MPTLRWDARRTGAVACAAGLALLADPGLVALSRGRLAFPALDLYALALALELLAFAFWSWSRASADAVNQLRRWTWLRRPAQALWLAAAAATLIPSLVPGSTAALWIPRVAALPVGLGGLAFVAAPAPPR